MWEEKTFKRLSLKFEACQLNWQSFFFQNKKFLSFPTRCGLLDDKFRLKSWLPAHSINNQLVQKITPNKARKNLASLMGVKKLVINDIYDYLKRWLKVSSCGKTYKVGILTIENEGFFIRLSQLNWAKKCILKGLIYTRYFVGKPRKFCYTKYLRNLYDLHPFFSSYLWCFVYINKLAQVNCCCNLR